MGVSAGSRGSTGSKHELRRLQTRAKLMNAGQQVMGEKGIDATTIADITERAGVGFGSFYNHFESQQHLAKEIFLALTEQLGQFAVSIEKQIPDHALALAYIGRAYMTLAELNPMWGRFMAHAENFFPQVETILNTRGRRHIGDGIKSGRLKASKPFVANALVLACFVEIIRMTVEHQRPKSERMEALEMVLRMFGIDKDEASEFVRAPWPADLKKSLNSMGNIDFLSV